MVRRTVAEVLEVLGQSIGERRVVPPIPAGSHVEVDPSADEQDERAEGAPEAVGEPLTLSLFIRYRNAAGEQSQRRITVRHVTGNPPTNLLAFCHERRAARSFRIDRISEIIDPETGEVIDTPALLVMLSSKGIAAIDPLARRMVNILVFMAGCDGRICPREWEAIDSMTASWCLRFGGGDAHCNELSRLARHSAPDADDLLIGLRSFAAQADRDRYGPWLQRAIDAVVSADERHAEEEFDWLIRVQDLLRLISRSRD